MTVSVFGLGKAGLPLACIIAKAGIDVIGVDINKSLVEKIVRGDSPLPEEPGLDALLAKIVAQRKLRATTDAKAAVKEATSHILLVPLFLDAKNRPDYSHIRKALAVVSAHLKKGDLVVIETTMPVGAMRAVVAPALERASKMKAGDDFFLAYSPERTMSGYALSRYREFPKILAGINLESTKVALGLYGRFSNVRAVSSMETAELIKVSEGIYRDVNVALANELYVAATDLGVDFWEMREAANHQFCDIHEAGNGTGGHCIPVYPWFLINAHKAQITRLARSVNDDMADYFAGRALAMVKKKKAAKVAVLGLTYRAHVKATYNSRAFALIAALKKKGLQVYGHDPLLSADEVKKTFGIPQAADFSAMDVLIIHNRDASYKDVLTPLRSRVLDLKNVLGNG